MPAKKNKDPGKNQSKRKRKNKDKNKRITMEKFQMLEKLPDQSQNLLQYTILNNKMIMTKVRNNHSRKWKKYKLKASPAKNEKHWLSFWFINHYYSIFQLLILNQLTLKGIAEILIR